MAKYGYVDVEKLCDCARNQTTGLTANHIMRFPRADVQPDSYVNAIYAELAELYGSPCNFSPQDEYMLENGKCEDCCGDIPDKECWKRYFETKLKR